MAKRIILDNELLQITLDRLCQQLIENHDQFQESVILALQPRGIIVGERIKSILEKSLKKKIPLLQEVKRSILSKRIQRLTA